MAGIAGIVGTGRREDVERMLHAIAHRGRAGHRVFETGGAAIGAVWPKCQPDSAPAEDGSAQDRDAGGRLALARVEGTKLILRRDWIGVAPLYYGWTQTGDLCFASEVKAMLKVAAKVHELPPGCELRDGKVESYWALGELKPVDGTPGPMAAELRQRLAEAVQLCIVGDRVGAWLSGGLDSSAMAALARTNVRTLHTFAGGLADSPDIDHAREAAHFIGSEHHEVIVTFEQMLDVLPDVIFHLESFDALLVRSSIVNYLVGKAASDYVGEVFSGEGGDELFAGYEYLRSVPRDRLHNELLDITGRLHNTALQRVDRCACAHGLMAHVPFLDPRVFNCALRIPVEYKGINGVEKWILRQAMAGALPERVLNRRKSKFWEGSGVGVSLADYADQRVSDDDFARERQLPNGWRLNSKEELMYYRIFKAHYGQLEDLSWIGRTKGAESHMGNVG